MSHVEQRYQAMQALFSKMDLLWAANLDAVPFEDARKLERAVHQVKEQCYAQLEALEPPFPRNLLSLVWHAHSCDVYAERHRVFEMTWGVAEGGHFSAFANPVAA